MDPMGYIHILVDIYIYITLTSTEILFELRDLNSNARAV